MTRRKSVTKWTLVLLVVILCPYVYCRPQDSPTIGSVPSGENVNRTTENPIRYRYRNSSIRTNSFNLPLATNFHNISETNLFHNDRLNNSTGQFPYINSTKNYRNNRMITKKLTKNYINTITNPKTTTMAPNFDEALTLLHRSKKPEIRKVITKWTDNTKYEDLDFSYETTTSDETGKNIFSLDTESTEDYSSTENINNILGSTQKHIHRKPLKQLLNKLKNKIHRRPKPKPQYPDDSDIEPDNAHITQTYMYPTTRPVYIFTTPTPTPIITNLGNPMPWPQPSSIQTIYQNQPNIHTVYRKPTTQRPIVVTRPLKDHYNYHNSVHNYPQYPGHEFEVTTFQPTNAYTDRIVIRPEEYAASPDECPTIFLTLNNTFQGQGKEACPDLNIAVNTNVVNKNVVVESDEEEGDGGLFADPFGIPYDEDSDEAANTDHNVFDSEENQEQAESASIEGLALTNYDGAGEGESAEPGGYGASSSVLSSLSKPRPPKGDDDIFGMSSIIQFFKPAISALGWLSTFNPLTFGLVSIFLAPIVFLFAGTSGLATLFVPWAFSGREAPKIVHVYRPYWHWDDEIKSWHLHSFPHTRKWNPNLPRSSGEVKSTNTGTVRETWFYKLKEWMKTTTNMLKQKSKSDNSNVTNRKNKRKKRETWTIRIK